MRIVLAYAGSLEGSVAIQWLHERYDADIVAVTLDLGQGRELEAVRDRALSLGAQRAHVIDARDRFAQEYVVPALRADALHEGRVPMALALSRPLMARTLVDVVAIEKADAVAHTGRATAGDSRLDRLLAALAPALPVLTPVREWALDEAALVAFARRHGLSAAGDATGLVESNFWGRSTLPDGVSSVAATPSVVAGSEPASVVVTFSRGVPTALNGVTLPLIELVASLGMLAERHGVGAVQSATVSCHSPAALLLHAAHRDLTAAASSPEARAFAGQATAAYVSAVEDARWFSPLREGLDAYFAAAQAVVSGHVHLRLSRGEFETTATEPAQPPSHGQRLRVAPSNRQH